MASTTEKVLKATIKMVDQYTAPARRVVAEAKKLEKFKKMVATIKANDMATKVIKKVTAIAKAFAKTTYKALVTVKDGASSILSKIKSTLGVLGAGITIGVGVNYTVGNAMDLENQQASIQFWNNKNGASKEEGDKYIKSLDKYSNNSMFAKSEVYSAGGRALGVTGNAKEAEKYLKLAGNMASAIPGKTINDAIEALADARNGEWERLKEFNFKGNADTDPKVLFEQMEERFGGASEAKKNTSSYAYEKAKKGLKDNFTNLGMQLLPTVTPMFNALSKTLQKLSPLFVSAGTSINSFLDKFSKSKEAKVLMDIFGTGAKAAFDMIKVAIDACRPTVENIMRFMQEHSEAITGGIEGLKNIWEGLCNILGPVLSVAWALIEPILLVFLSMVEDLGKFIKDVGDKWKAMSDAIKNNPVVAKVTTWFDGAGSRPQATDNSPKSQGTIFDKGKRSAYGTSRVTGNDVPYRLHSGEKVLTRAEADRYEKGYNNGGINIFMNGTTIREEADINRIAKALVRELKLSKDVAVMEV